MTLCFYGCGQEAKYYFKTVNKWCCSKSHNMCPINRQKNSLKNKGKSKNKIVEITTNQICSYGCKQKALFFFSESNKFCCNDHYKKCPVERSKCVDRVTGKNNGMHGKTHNEETKRKISALGRKHTQETRKKMRLSAIKNIEKNISNGGQMAPNYNPEACKVIDEYGRKYGYNFQHAENGGEIRIEELGYWVDGYDQEKNTIIEIDEPFHFDPDGNLLERDVVRQKEITEHLKCKFIRVRL